MYAEFLTCSG